MKMHDYEIVINKPMKRYKEFVYDYSSNRGKAIKLQIASNAIRVCVKLSTLYETERIAVSSNHIFSDAIKKALLLHLVLYSKNINVQSMSVSIDKDEDVIPIVADGIQPPIYSLVTDKLVYSVSQKWRDASFLESLLTRTKSNQDTRWASVFAALCAKSKKFEIERFIYLWMSFNGIYNYFSQKINILRPLTKKGQKPIPTEKEELQWILQLYGLGEEAIKKDDSKRIANEVISIFRKVDISLIKSSEDISNELRDSIESVALKDDGTKYNITAIGYLTVCFSYHFRCNVFHADRPLPLFCYADDMDLKCLHLINILLENFIDENMLTIFNEEIFNTMFSEKIKLIANTKKQGEPQ